MFISKSIRKSQPSVDLLNLIFFTTVATWAMLVLIESDEEEKKAIK